MVIVHPNAIANTYTGWGGKFQSIYLLHIVQMVRQCPVRHGQGGSGRLADEQRLETGKTKVSDKKLV